MRVARLRRRSRSWGRRRGDRVVRVHEPRVVAEPVLREQRRCPEVHVPGRGSVADRPHAEHRIERLEAAQQIALLRGLVDAADALVQVPVVADSWPASRTDRATSGDLGDPARDEERRPQADPIQHPQQARHRHTWAVALMGDHVEVVGDLRMVGQHHGLGVEVEAEERGARIPSGQRKPGGRSSMARTILGP